MAKTLDEEFIKAMDDLFGDYAIERFGDKTTSHLRTIWDRARLIERKAAFEFMRKPAQTNRCSDKEWIYQVSWVIGNGTYLDKPTLDKPLSWWSVEEVITIDDDIKNQLVINAVQNDIGVFRVTLANASWGEGYIADIYEEEDENEATTYKVELIAGPHRRSATRIVQSWDHAIHTIIAWLRARANGAV